MDPEYLAMMHSLVRMQTAIMTTWADMIARLAGACLSETESVLDTVTADPGLGSRNPEQTAAALLRGYRDWLRQAGTIPRISLLVLVSELHRARVDAGRAAR